MRRSSAAGLIAWLDELPADARSIAGGKGASLSRMIAAGLPAPPGFVVCAAAFHAFLDSCGGGDVIRRLTGGLDVQDDAALQAAADGVRGFILSNALPGEVEAAIASAYLEMGGDTLVAVRSSAVGEDGEAASFAGQQETFLNIRGAALVSECVKKCWASFYTPRAMFYRAQKGSLVDVDMAVVAQEMALGEKSGVMFTIDPVLKCRDHMIIEAALGLGEALVSGEITPDHYVVDREDGSVVREYLLAQSSGARVLEHGELNELREMGLRLEALFGGPQDVEWCIRGAELLLLQSRPITTL